MTTASVATVVMYHFVQPRGAGPVAGLKAIDLTAFREQLAYIRRHYTPVSPFDLVRSAADGSPLPPQPIVLTFDDGYRGHREHVLPLLQDLGIPATFFPVASALLERQLLDVNKIQCVLAGVDDLERLVRDMDALVAEAAHKGVCLAPSEYRAAWWKPSRWDPPPVVYVKRLLQHALPEAVRVPLVRELFRKIVAADERAFADALYMDVGDLREVAAAGMTIGAHGDKHIRLPTLSRDGQAREIDGALRVLDAASVAREPFVYCYANGEHDATSVDLLRARGCRIAFTTRPDLARLDAAEMLTLPRLDANDVPADADAPPSEWTRRASTAPGAF